MARKYSFSRSTRLLAQEEIIKLRRKTLTRKPKPKQDEATGQYLPNGAAAKGGLNKSILDAGWATFVEMCSVKAAWAGRTLLKVDPRSTSQVCSGCGQVREKELSERWHSCDCGTELDRDVNVAINILERGRKCPTQAVAGTFRHRTA